MKAVARSKDRIAILGCLLILLSGIALLNNGLATALVRANMYDFLCFYGASQGLLRGVDFYDWDETAKIAAEYGEDNFLNVYPPLSSLMFAPLALLPWSVATRIWTLLSLAALIAFVVLLGRWFLRGLDGSTRLIWAGVGLMLIAMYHSLGHAFQVGQVTMIVAALLMGVLTLARDRRDNAAAGLLSVAFFFKPTAVVLILYFLLKRRWRLVLYSLAGITILLLISVAVLGVPIHESYVQRMIWYFDRVDPGVNYQDAPSFWARLVAREGVSPFPQYAHLLKPLSRLSLVVIMVPTVLLLWRRRWEELSDGALLAEFGLLLTAVLLTQNQSAIHAWFLPSIALAGAAIYIREMDPDSRRFWWLAVGWAAAWCLIALPFQFREPELRRGLLVLATSSKFYGGLVLWGVLLAVVSGHHRDRAGTAEAPEAEPLPVAEDDLPQSTVLVPSYRRPEALLRCLEGIMAGTHVPEQIVVVLRESDGDSREALQRCAMQEPARRDLLDIAEVSQPGPMAAANAGLAIARGEIVSQIDDDCVPAPDWLQRLLSHYVDPEVIGAGGRDRVHHGETISAVPAAVVGRITWYGRIVGNHHQPDFVEARSVDHLKGANMSFRRRVIPEYDLQLRSGVHHEIDVSLGALQHGGRIVYDPLAIVDHYPAQRHYGHPRDSEALQAVTDLAHDHAWVMFKHLPAARRAGFWLFALLIGQHWRYGLLRMLVMLPREGRTAFLRFRAAMRGLFAAAEGRRRLEEQVGTPVSEVAGEAR